MKTTKALLFFIFFAAAQLSFVQTTGPEPTGKLIDIGGYRLHIDVKGKGSPAVIFIAGSQAFSFDWSLVAPSVAAITQTVTYDRPALAWSDPGPMPVLLNRMCMNCMSCCKERECIHLTF
jgi:pimeloyl-ACP methyl ester carboxylesterase